MISLRRRMRADGGAIAIMVALLSLTLFTVAALAVDIGAAYQRRRATQTSADLAALAGAQDLPDAAAARATAIAYLRRNLPDAQNLPLGTWDSDGDPANGEITVTNASGAIATNDGARIRVLVPPRRVVFGLATAIGFRSTTVSATAAAEIASFRSSVPFYVTADTSAQVCWRRSTGEAEDLGSAMRQALLRPGAQPQTAGPPTIDGLSPGSGPERTATRVTITGSGFDTAGGATDVIFNGRTPGEVVSVTTTQIVVETPLLPAGVARVTVTTPTGASNSVDYTFTPAPVAGPVLSTVSPVFAPELTASPFTIVGSGFIGASIRVEFGGVPATNVVVSSASRLTGLTPAGVPAGVAAILVYADGVASSNTLPFTFTSATLGPPPVVTRVSPPRGPEAGGTVVTVTGANFTGTPVVYFGSTPATTTVISTAQLRAISPPGVGVVNVTVLADAGLSAATPADEFTYVPAPLDICSTESTQRGYVDVPRAGGRDIIHDIAAGIDHALLAYGAVPAGYPQCSTLPGAVLGTNCLRTDERVPGDVLRKGFFEGAGGDPGRMYNMIGGGHTTGSISRYDNVDEDELADYVDTRYGSVAALEAAIQDPNRTPTPGWLRADIATCPRFSVIPVLNVPASGPATGGAYPIVGFKGMFIDDVPDALPNDHGFDFNGSAFKGVSAWIFDLDYVSGVLPAGDFPTVAYVGGPKIVRLVE